MPTIFFKKTLPLNLLIIVIFSACSVKRQKETVATYLGHDINGVYGHGGNDTWEYIIDGKTQRTDAWNGKIVGAKYIMIFDSLHNSRNKIIQHRPVFIKGEKTDTTIGIVTESYFFSHNTLMSISYKYQVKGIWFESFEFKTAILKNILPKIGDTLMLEYWLNNPKRTILKLDKSIK